MASEIGQSKSDLNSEDESLTEPMTVVQNGVLETHFDDQPVHKDEEYQGPHDWRKRLKPVKSPINEGKNDPDETDSAYGSGSRAIKDSRKVKEKFDDAGKAEKPRRIPSWKRHLIEKKKRGNTKFNKPVAVSNEITKKRIVKVQRARLYLLQQTGPNSFLIGGDSPDHKFRVIIGPQVENLFRQYHDKVSSRIQSRKLADKQKQGRKAERSGTPSPESTPAPSEADVGSVKEDEDTCPICLLEMLEGERFELCRRQNDPLICPLCRAKWKTNHVEVKSDTADNVLGEDLRTLRTILSYTPCRDDSQRGRLQAFLKPVVDAIIFKCTDGMRKTSQLSLSTIVELAKSQAGELAVGKEILNPGTLGLDGFDYVIKCVTEDYNPSEVTWQWLLGRLYVIEKLFDEFQNDLLPRNPPEGKSGDETSSSVGAGIDEIPTISSHDRLIAIAQFSVRAVTNSHMRICRMARRVFWLCARFAAHMDYIIEELERMVDQLDSNIALSMKRRLLKIVGEFQLSEKLVHELNHGISKGSKHFEDSLDNSPGNTPVSTPRCNSPVNSYSDCQSEAGSIDSKSDLTVPPNTPIRYRRRRKERRLGKDLHEEELKNVVDVYIEEKVAKPKVRTKTHQPLNSPDSDILTSTPDHSSVVMTPPPPVPPRSNRRGSVDLLNEVMNLPPHPRIKRFNSCDITNNNAVDSVTADDLKSLAVIKPDFSLPLEGALNSSLRKHDLSLPFGRGNLSGEDSILDDTDKNNKEYYSDIACASPLTPENKIVQQIISSEKDITPTSNLQPKYDSTTEFQMYFHSSDERTLSSDDSIDRLSSRHRSKQEERFPTAEQGGGTSSDEILDMTSNSEVMSPSEKPVSFLTEVTMPTPKNSPGHVTEHRDNEECHCKEEVEKEEALALAKAMEVSGIDPPKPVVPGLTPTDREEVVTIRIQPDDRDGKSPDNNGNPPKLYLENVHWVKGPLLGTGAYSTCYQARDVQTGVIMAVKQISYCRNSPTEQEQVIETITAEIQMMAKLNHPHIVRIMGATRQGCHFNMFNEWMPGMNDLLTIKHSK
ncbi:hypothetical protein KUTeg_016764 [Tegillarca granosa]|uniref:Protein kinase domain-containing protein n=1 Tax=Tegillarca granosa TaxID=220873 RepID=A0ABQ9ELY0_TEGGR|nr:hypothetical protein KUTeg_016764 [Tegillarca granosa]